MKKKSFRVVYSLPLFIGTLYYDDYLNVFKKFDNTKYGDQGLGGCELEVRG